MIEDIHTKAEDVAQNTCLAYTRPCVQSLSQIGDAQRLSISTSKPFFFFFFSLRIQVSEIVAF